MADQWLSWRLDCISACLILVVAMLAISQRRTLSPSLTALSLTEVLDVTGFLKYAVQVRPALYSAPVSCMLSFMLCTALHRTYVLEAVQDPIGSARLFAAAAEQAAAMFEARFNSVERILAYVNLPQEAPALIEDTKSALLLLLRHLLGPESRSCVQRF